MYSQIVVSKMTLMESMQINPEALLVLISRDSKAWVKSTLVATGSIAITIYLNTPVINCVHILSNLQFGSVSIALVNKIVASCSRTHIKAAIQRHLISVCCLI